MGLERWEALNLCGTGERWEPVKLCRTGLGTEKGSGNHDFRSYAYGAVPVSRIPTFSQKVLFPLRELKLLESGWASGPPEKCEMTHFSI